MDYPTLRTKNSLLLNINSLILTSKYNTIHYCNCNICTSVRPHKFILRKTILLFRLFYECFDFFLLLGACKIEFFGGVLVYYGRGHPTTYS